MDLSVLEVKTYFCGNCGYEGPTWTFTSVPNPYKPDYPLTICPGCGRHYSRTWGYGGV